MAMTAAVKDELARLIVTRTCCRKAEVSAILRFAGRLHLVSGRIVIEAELDTGAAARRLRKDILEVFGHASRPRGDGARRAAPRHPLRRPGGRRTATRWPGRPAWSTAAAAPSGGCPRRSSPAPPVTPRRPGAAPSWPTARSPSPAAPPPWRSPAPARRPRSRWSARPAGWHPAKAREVRGVDRVVVRDGDAIGALLTRLGAHEPCWPGRSGGCAARCGPRRTGSPTSTTPTCAARRAPPSPPAPASQRALEILGEEVPEHLRRRPAAHGAQAGLPGGAGRARRPAADQGRGRRPDPPAAGDGRQAGQRPRYPGTEANLTADMMTPDPR